MKLTVRSLQLGDFGNYRCISKNSLGETEGSIRLYGKCVLIDLKSIVVLAYLFLLSKERVMCPFILLNRIGGVWTTPELGLK